MLTELDKTVYARDKAVWLLRKILNVGPKRRLSRTAGVDEAADVVLALLGKPGDVAVVMEACPKCGISDTPLDAQNGGVCLWCVVADLRGRMAKIAAVFRRFLEVNGPTHPSVYTGEAWEAVHLAEKHGATPPGTDKEPEAVSQYYGLRDPALARRLTEMVQDKTDEGGAAQPRRKE